MTVRMKHPTLPPEQTIDVQPATVRAHERMGWTVVDGQAPETPSTAEGKSPRRSPKENS
ncbi:hypothetical protein [Streptomyces niveus]|uniref:hypothetical protein n=1 Tax=Streptomyces niveus TaxID=193462 RepID=UPI0033AE75FC